MQKEEKSNTGYKIIEIYNENGKPVKTVLKDAFLKYLFDKNIKSQYEAHQ